MINRIKFEELSNEIRKEIEEFHAKEMQGKQDIPIEESMIKWLDTSFDGWVNKRFKIDDKENKRKHFRLNVEIPIRIIETLVESSHDDKEAIDLVGNIINISKGGLYFKYNAPIEISSIIKVYIDLSRIEQNLDNIEALAMVVRVDELEDNDYGIGLMFSSIYDTDRFNLNLFILKYLSYHFYTEH